MQATLNERGVAGVSEIWIANMPHDKENGFLGRMCFSLTDQNKFPWQTYSLVEMIQGTTNPREIEQYPKLKEYVSFAKNDFTHPFKVKEIFSDNEEALLEKSKPVLGKLASSQKRIIDFGLFLKNQGANELSIDFRHAHGETMIWDWDTDNMRTIVHRYLEKCSDIEELEAL